jgi:ADP-ribose pyrophosphatase
MLSNDPARVMSTLEETPLSSEQLVDGRLLKVYRDDVRLPDGATSQREWIDHPGASAVVPILSDGRTLLVRQFRYAPRRTFLEVPAGKLDHPNEDPVDVAARELEEETGWHADRFELVSSMHPCIGYSSEVIHTFLAFDLQEGEQQLADGEFVEVVTLPFEEAVERARRGLFKDMKTVTAILQAAAYLQNHEVSF